MFTQSDKALDNIHILMFFIEKKHIACLPGDNGNVAAQSSKCYCSSNFKFNSSNLFELYHIANNEIIV